MLQILLVLRHTSAVAVLGMDDIGMAMAGAYGCGPPQQSPCIPISDRSDCNPLQCHCQASEKSNHSLQQNYLEVISTSVIIALTARSWPPSLPYVGELLITRPILRSIDHPRRFLEHAPHGYIFLLRRHVSEKAELAI